MKSLTIAATVVLVAAGAFVVFVPSYTGVPRAAVQVGLPQQVQFFTVAEQSRLNQSPAPLPPAPAGGADTPAHFKNVTVLTDVGAAEFMRLQTAITAWVAPEQGCSFCHGGSDYASDARPEKRVARVMLLMTRHLNSDWTKHLAGAGVTCYTCHRGQPVPPEIWFPSTPPQHNAFIDRQENWRESADTVRKFFPDDSYAEYLYDDEPISVQSTTVEPSGTVSSRIEAKRIYELMMTMSDGIGVNCGYCHNSRYFASWAQSTPYRWIGYDGIRLLRDINTNYLRRVASTAPQTRALTKVTNLPVLPPQQVYPQTGNGLALCATCHLGITRPLNGVNLVHDYPELIGSSRSVPVAKTAASPPPAG